MSEPTPYQTIEERLASVETKTDRLIVEVDAGRGENQAAFKELRSLLAANDVAIRADMQEVERPLGPEIKETETGLRAEIMETEARLIDHTNKNTVTVLNYLRLIALIMVSVFLGVLGILAKMIYSSG